MYELIQVVIHELQVSEQTQRKMALRTEPQYKPLPTALPNLSTGHVWSRPKQHRKEKSLKTKLTPESPPTERERELVV